jgi:hypothetical protein
MSAFMIFVEGADAPVSRKQIEAAGLGHAFDGVPNHAKMAGPGGRQGVMLSNVAKLDPYQPVYRPNEQTWRKAPAALTPLLPWHLGYYNAAPPTSADLARPEQIAGNQVELHGQPWQVPMVRTTRLDGTPRVALPSYLQLGDDGRPRQGAVVDELAWLLERVTPFWDAWLEGYEASSDEEDSFTITMPDSIFADAAAVLSANYYVGPVECEALRLFRNDDGSLSKVMGAACDTASAIMFLKKKAAA